MLTISKCKTHKKTFVHNHMMHLCAKFQVKRVQIGPAREQNSYFILVGIQPLLQTSITVTKTWKFPQKGLLFWTLYDSMLSWHQKYCILGLWVQEKQIITNKVIKLCLVWPLRPKWPLVWNFLICKFLWIPPVKYFQIGPKPLVTLQLSPLYAWFLWVFEKNFPLYTQPTVGIIRTYQLPIWELIKNNA